MAKGSFFRRFGLITIGAIYLLILVGGIVRSTGSGMGCPDWPKCFGQYVPPTDVSQLPTNYQEIYAEKRAKKNLRVANMIEKMGFADTAHKIRNDKSILEEAPFNATKTWIEYINRLIGALIGLFVIITGIASLSYWKQDKSVTVFALLSVILVGFQGWIGSIVVSTNLLPGMISIHMVLALLIVSFLVYIIARSYKGVASFEQIAGLKKANMLLIAGMAIFLGQILLGTQVREQIDHIVMTLPNLARAEWVDNIGLTFYIHRSYSLVILGLHGFLWWSLNRNIKTDSRLKLWNQALLGCIVLEIATGTMMAYFAIPAFLQPIHLLFANLIFGIQFLLFLLLNFGRFFPADKAATGTEEEMKLSPKLG